MRPGDPKRVHSKEAGFSMIEMLITAFIMAVGILGLTMLQTMSMKASRGGKSLSSAILVGDQIMDRVEMEGRLSWLNLTDTNRAKSTIVLTTDLPNLRYITTATTGATGLKEYFTSKGDATTATAPDMFFTVTTKRVVATAVQTGRISDVTVRVQFSDSLDSSNVAIPREISLTRRILHG